MQFIEADSSTTTIISQIQNNSAQWKWANNPENLGRLKDTHAELITKLGEFGKAFLLKDTKEAKAEWGADFLTVEVKKFNKLDEDVEQLAKLVKKMMKACKAQNED